MLCLKRGNMKRVPLEKHSKSHSLTQHRDQAWPLPYERVHAASQILRLFFVVLVTVLLTLAIRIHPAHANEDDRFSAFVQSLWPQAHARGVSRRTFDAAFKGITPDPAVIALTKKQAEFVKPIGDYLASAVSQKRIDKGQAVAREWKALLEKSEQRFGVDCYIVLAVWGMETNFGGFTGEKSTIRSLATLAFARYRGDYFKQELLTALEILEHGDVAPKDMQGSWAGAMGQTQFMPSSYKRYAVDFDGDGRRDIWNTIPDALGSTANYLRRHGWIEGETWGYEIVLPRSLQAQSSTQMRPFRQWAAEGIKRADGESMPATGEASLLLPAGRDGPAFLVTRNFKVIKSYNNSTSYALGVALLSDRIAGWGPLRASWPVAER